jgi:hypothetical protein
MTAIYKHDLDLCRREHWSLFSTFTTWQQVLDITKKESRDHQTLSEIYGNQMVQRFNSIIDNSQRIHRSVSHSGAHVMLFHLPCYRFILKSSVGHVQSSLLGKDIWSTPSGVVDYSRRSGGLLRAEWWITLSEVVDYSGRSGEVDRKPLASEDDVQCLSFSPTFFSF